MITTCTGQHIQTFRHIMQLCGPFVLLLTACIILEGSAHAMEKPATDIALESPTVITDPGPEYADSARVWQGIPGIERAANGRLWATWYSGGTTEGMYNYVLLYTSGDDGASWEQVLIVDPAGVVRAFDPCLWCDPLGRLWLFWGQGYGGNNDPAKVTDIWDGRAGVWAIVADNPGEANPQWSAPKRLCNGIMMNKPTVTSTGAWLVPAAVWRLAGSPDYPHSLPEEGGANVVGSRDQGSTWTRFGGANVPEAAFDEHMVIERADKSLWMLLRTKRGIGESVSTDGGRTWSAGNSAIFGGLPSARFFLRRLRSGNLLLVRHNPPNGKGRSHLMAYLSEDDGASWIGGLLLDKRSGVSYPDGVETDDRRIYVIYDFDRYKTKEVFMTVFTEEDVKAKKYASPAARERVLVNKATGERKE
jgi:predicted neuraminidase